MKFLNALNKIEGLGQKKIKILMNFFDSAEDVWKADFSILLKSGIGEKFAQRIIEQRGTINPDEEWIKLEKENVTMLSLKDENYPSLLGQIPDCPYALYTKGNLDCLKMPLVAIVGSRKYGHGRRAAFRIRKRQKTGCAS